MFVRGNGYQDLLCDARTVKIPIDSQLGRIANVVSAPIPHPRFLNLSWLGSKSLSPSVRRYLGWKGFLA